MSTPPAASIRRAVLAMAAGFTVVFILFLTSPAWTPVKNDEMTELAAGVRLAREGGAYTTFFEFFPPVTMHLHASLFRIVGARVVPFRLFMALAWLAGWFLVWRAAASGGDHETPAWACIAGAWTFAWWPVSYHHWWGAIGMLLLVAASRHPRPGRWLRAAGWLAGLALPYTDQPMAILAAFGFCAALLENWRVLERRSRLLTDLSVLACAHGALLVLLGATGKLAPLWRATVLWPLTHYKQAGGINDTTLWSDIAARVRAAEGGASSLLLAVALATCVAAPLIILVPLRNLPGSRRWPGLVVFAMIPIFFAGKGDMVHWMFLMPAVLALAPAGARAGAGNRAWTLYLAIALAIAFPRIARVPSLAPPAASWRNVDAMIQGQEVMTAAREASEANGGSLAVLSRGGPFVFYGLPTPLPWTVILPEREHYMAPESYMTCASILGKQRPRYILLFPEQEAAPLLTEPNPLGTLLREDYAPARRAGAGLLLERNPGP